MNDLIHKQGVYYSATRTDMLKYIDNKPKRILEIGCGEGNFAQNFPNAEYWGVEPNEEVVRKATTIGRRVLLGTYEAVAGKIPNNHFDLIACNDVIEHMVDPISFLKDVKAKLRSGGKLIASIPNIRYAPLLFNLVFHGEFDYTESGLMDYTHLHFFTPKSFTKIASRCGWIVEISEPLSIAPFKPLKKLILKLLENGSNDMRNIQFAVRLSPAPVTQSP